MSGQDKIYQMITDRIIEMIESEEKLPWNKPWKNSHGSINDSWAANCPRNLISKKPYRGINLFLLSNAVSIYGNPFFLSFKQAKNLKGTVKKGEKGFPVIFWKMQKFEEKNNTTGETKDKMVPLLRYYTVFNIDQTTLDKNSISAIKDFYNPPKEETESEPKGFSPIEKADSIWKDWLKKPELRHSAEGRAFYSPFHDFIHLPNREQFKSNSEYYSTLFHEATHSTGHKSRLNREGINNEMVAFGDASYSKEELTAEIGACFLCAISGIEKHDVFSNSIAYLQGWVRKFREKPKMIVQASARAQKAVDMILNIKWENKDN
jgi:antirestriction protein ArdC